MRIGLFVGAIVALVLLVGVSGAQELSPREFRDEVRRALTAQRADFCVKNVDDFTLNFGPSASECGSQLNIDNGYGDYRLDASRKETIIGRLVSTAIGILNPPSATAEQAKARLVAIIRPQNYAATAVTKPFVGNLALFLVLDSDDRLELVLKDRLKSMHMSEADAWTLAQKNIGARLGPLEKGRQSGITIVGAKSGLAPSALLLPEACDSRGSSEVVLLANRDNYFSVSENDADGLKTLRDVARRMIADGASMSQTLIVCRAGKWLPAGPG